MDEQNEQKEPAQIQQKLKIVQQQWQVFFNFCAGRYIIKSPYHMASVRFEEKPRFLTAYYQFYLHPSVLRDPFVAFFSFRQLMHHVAQVRDNYILCFLPYGMCVVFVISSNYFLQASYVSDEVCQVSSHCINC